MDASRGTAGQRTGSRRTSSASAMEFSSNTGTSFRTRLRKRNPRVVYLCSEAVSLSDYQDYSQPSFHIPIRRRESGEATTRAKAIRSLIAHGSVRDSDQGGRYEKARSNRRCHRLADDPPVRLGTESDRGTSARRDCPLVR